MSSSWRRAGIVLSIAALLAVAVLGLLTGESTPPNRAYELQQDLRCPVCKSVSIAESDSETARAMRAEVARQVGAGHSDAEVIEYFEARYGEWVLLDPPLAGTTLAVWLLPAAGALAGATVLLTRSRRPSTANRDLPPALRERVNAELERLRGRAEP